MKDTIKDYIFWWLILCLIFVSLLLVVAPARGVYYFSDDGLFLRMAWDAANGFGWDSMLPQSPSYLIHAILIKLGVTELLHFRYINTIFSLFTATIFFAGIDNKSLQSASLPLSISLSILVSLNSVLNPNSLTINIFLLSAGLYFISLRQTNILLREVLLNASGFCFALAGFMHAAASIATMITILFIVLINKKTRRSFFWVVYVISLSALWIWYINQIGIQEFIEPPVAHNPSILYFLKRILLIFTFVIPVFIFYFFNLLIYQQKDPLSIILLSKYQCSWLVVFCSGLSIVNYLYGFNWRFLGIYPIFQLPGLIVYPFIFAMLHWALTLPNQFVVLRPKPLFSGNQPVISFISVIARCLKLMFVQLRKNRQHEKIFISILGFILLASALAVGSNTYIIQGFVFFAGPLAGFVVYLWSTYPNNSDSHTYKIENVWKSWRLFGLCWLIIFGIFSFNYNHPDQEKLRLDGKLIYATSPLSGILITSKMKDSLDQLKKIYLENNCSSRPLLLLDYAPILHYFLKSPAPHDIGVIRPAHYYPERKIFDFLESQQHWCVLDLSGEETLGDILNKNKDRRAPVRDFLEKNGRALTIISPGSDVKSDLVLYVR
jgi:hypothetical protein